MVTAFSQTPNQERTLPQFIDYETATGVINLFVPYPEAPYIGMRGDPFLDKDFKNGYIVLDDSIKLTQIPIRYNIYQQRMELWRDSTIYAFNYPNMIDTVHFGNKDFIYMLYNQNNVRYYGYFEVLNKGTNMLLKRYTCDLQPGYYNIQMSAGDRSNQFIKFEHYYLTKGNNPATLLRPKRKSLAKILSVSIQDLTGFIKENKLNIKHEEDLVRLFEHFNSKI
jgi:hypothetical protein